MEERIERGWLLILQSIMHRAGTFYRREAEKKMGAALELEEVEIHGLCHVSMKEGMGDGASVNLWGVY